MDLKHFHYIDQHELQSLCSTRAGETKLGQTLSSGVDWRKANSKFILLGIEESIGVKANLGVAGTHTAWSGFLKAFLNSQNTRKLEGSHIHLLGSFNFEDLYAKAKSLEDYRNLVTQMDDTIYPLLQDIVKAEKIPIIIGGSHANAFPIIKGCSKAKEKKLNIINLDAHADFRSLEGRHSGNPFSKAKKEGYMKSYKILGLHENYNSQNMLDDMDSQEDILYYFWEDIYLRDQITFKEALRTFIAQLQNKVCGIELDVDSIAGVLSSAKTPSGFSTTEARYYAYQCARQLSPSYFHLCEAAVELESGLTDSSTGKLLSYLVTDFIKGILEKE